MAARKNTPTLNEGWKHKIRVGVIVDRLDKHVNGELEMTATQINAAKILLGKTIPDLNRMDVGNADDKPFQTETTLKDSDREILDRWMASNKNLT